MTSEQGDQVIALLTHIAGLMEMVLGAVITDGDGCQHPEEKRISLSTFGDRDHWVCGLCRYDNKAS